MNEEEQAVLDALGHAANLYARLPVMHICDRPEFIEAIHAAQNIVLARGSLRALRNAGKELASPGGDR